MGKGKKNMISVPSVFYVYLSLNCFGLTLTDFISTFFKAIFLTDW